jgi:hypothetical protein
MRIRKRDFFSSVSLGAKSCHKLPALRACSVLHFIHLCKVYVQKVIKLRYEVLKAVSITCQPHPPFLAATELATRSRVQMPAHKNEQIVRILYHLFMVLSVYICLVFL